MIKNFSFLYTALFVLSLSACSISKEVKTAKEDRIKTKDLIGAYEYDYSKDYVMIDSMKIKIPRYSIGLVLSKRKTVYLERVYQGDNGLAPNPDGTIPKFYRRGKWQIKSDTVFIRFSEVQKSSNASYLIRSDSLIPISGFEKTVWTKIKG